MVVLALASERGKVVKVQNDRREEREVFVVRVLTFPFGGGPSKVHVKSLSGNKGLGDALKVYLQQVMCTAWAAAELPRVLARCEYLYIYEVYIYLKSGARENCSRTSVSCVRLIELIILTVLNVAPCHAPHSPHCFHPGHLLVHPRRAR